jgi:hypothetical protein
MMAENPTRGKGWIWTEIGDWASGLELLTPDRWVKPISTAWPLICYHKLDSLWCYQNSASPR